MAPPEAKEQIKKTIDWVSGLGQLRFEAHYGERDFRLEIRYLPYDSHEGAAEPLTHGK